MEGVRQPLARMAIYYETQRRPLAIIADPGRRSENIIAVQSLLIVIERGKPLSMTTTEN